MFTTLWELWPEMLSKQKHHHLCHADRRRETTLLGNLRNLGFPKPASYDPQQNLQKCTTEVWETLDRFGTNWTAFERTSYRRSLETYLLI
uniref:Uncharacterized protein n=1 Tax=Steinernema glaseri TaxID=37863 RepID=A0A1I7YXM0_9BILA